MNIIELWGRDDLEETRFGLALGNPKQTRNVIHDPQFILLRWKHEKSELPLSNLHVLSRHLEEKDGCNYCKAEHISC